MKKILVSCLLTAVIVASGLIVGAGYFLGNYMVHFGLERGTAENPQEPPKAYALLMPPEARQFTKPDYPSEEWTETSFDGLMLKATHFSPGRRSHRWVIVAHGYGCTQQNSYYIAANYLAQGYEVLTPDLRAAGSSEGRYLTMGYLESRDLVGWAQKIAAADPEARIILHGVSMGAASVMMASSADELPANVVACVEDCGYTDAYDLLAYQLEASFSLPSFPAMNLIDWRCREKTGFSLHQASPLVAEQHAKIPTLFIHGDKDTLVPPEMARQLYDASTAPKKELLMIAGAVHAAASQKDQKRYFAAIRDFVAPYMEGIQ